MKSKTNFLTTDTLTNGPTNGKAKWLAGLVGVQHFQQSAQIG